jgi:hypothetical protein
MDTQELCSMREAYVLDGLTDEERRQFEEHLNICPECQQEVPSLREVADWMLYDFDEVEIPEGMESRVLASVFGDELDEVDSNTAHSVGVQTGTAMDSGSTMNSDSVMNSGNVVRIPQTARPSRRTFILRWLTPIAASILILAGGSAYLYRQNAGLSPLRESVGTVQTQLPMTAVTKGSAAVLTVADRLSQESLLIRFSGLPETKGSQIYQVWAIKPGQAPKSLGVFYPGRNGQALFASVLPKGYPTVAVTLEPHAIDKQPEGKKMFVATLT